MKRDTTDKPSGRDDVGLSVQVLQEFYAQATRAPGCDEVFTEDMSHGQRIAGVAMTGPSMGRCL